MSDDLFPVPVAGRYDAYKAAHGIATRQMPLLEQDDSGDPTQAWLAYSVDCEPVDPTPEAVAKLAAAPTTVWGASETEALYCYAQRHGLPSAP